MAGGQSTGREGRLEPVVASRLRHKLRENHVVPRMTCPGFVPSVALAAARKTGASWCVLRGQSLGVGQTFGI